MNKVFIMIMASCIVFCLGCNDGNTVINKQGQGEYCVKKIENTNMKAINLGTLTINSTIDFQFLLLNTGLIPIKNTVMTPYVEGTALSENDFTITPQNIEIMNPSNTDQVEYIIVVTLNHGLVYGKIGTYNLLNGLTKMGLHIDGYTSNDGVDFNIPVSIDVEINTNVKVADWKIQSSINGIDWTDDTGSGNGSYIWTGTVNSWRRLVNTGNVPIGFLDLNGGAIYNLEDYTIVQPNGILTIGNSYSIHIATYGVMYNYSTNHPNPSANTNFINASIINEFTQ